ncbi:hypothetical protein [Amycolatopsis sp. QT-25]|uniref:hypothetical protein n=1 Tax=Amycolatopsis sp. QT-25 TaxID=3034022 RepID=UPI00320A64ED
MDSDLADLADLAGRRGPVTDLVVGEPVLLAASGEWWSRTPLAAGEALTTSLAPDAVTALRLVEEG